MPNLNSMTAYARDEQNIGPDTLVWELRSVNHRYLDAHFRLPENLRQFEQVLIAALGQRVSRGRVDVNLNIDEPVGVDLSGGLDQAAIEKWSSWQDQIHAVIPNAVPVSVLKLIKEGEVFKQNDITDSLDEKTLLNSFNKALDGLLTARSAEGGRLQQVLAEKLDQIKTLTKTLVSDMPEYEQAHQLSWQTKLEKFQSDQLDPVRLHQEIAILIAKSDITEELDRLTSHITEFSSALHSSKPVGRRLDFLLQEFNREANTLGSKSMHRDITNTSVELKVLIDQLREQVQNIE